MAWRRIRRMEIVGGVMRSQSKSALSAGPWSRRVASVGVALLLALSFVAPRSGEIHASSPDGVRVVQSDLSGVTLEMTFSAVERDSVSLGGRPFDVLTIPGLAQSGEAGRPQAPVKGAMVAIPPGSHLELSVLETTGGPMEGRFRLAPAPTAIVRYPDGDAPVLVQEWVPDDAVYGRDSLYPESQASLGETGNLRDQPYVVVRFSPVQYNPIRGEAYFWSTIRVRVSFGSSSRAVSASRPENPVFGDLLRNSMVNYKTVYPQSLQAPVLAASQVVAAASPVYKISIDREGVYQVTYAQLQAAGFPVDSVDPQNLQLSNNGAEVAIDMAVKEDGKLDSFLFYGKGVDNKFTGVEVFQLAVGSGGKRMAVRGESALGAPETTFTDTVHAEENHEYYSSWPMESGSDHWYWGRVLALNKGAGASVSYTVTLSGVVTGAYTATLDSSFRSYTSSSAVNPDHHVRLYVNNHLVKDATWDGVALAPGSADFPQAWLQNGANIIKVELPNDTGVNLDAVAVNWFEISYRRELTAVADYLRLRGGSGGSHTYQVGGLSRSDVRVFDVSDRTNLVKINGVVSPGAAPFSVGFADTTGNVAEYVVVSTEQWRTPTSISTTSAAGLKSAGNGADLIIITPTEFYTSVLTLADHRSQQGFRVKVAKVEDIYDEFGYGMVDPEAIRTFLAYSYSNWQAPAPSNVLLMGDGNYDFRNYLGTGEKNYVPPYLAFVDPWLGETASDTIYVTFGNDVMPKMFVGRLPVSSSSQASAMISKILTYEQNATSGDWRGKVVFVADSPGKDANFIDFHGLSDDVADRYLPKSYSAKKDYLCVDGDLCAAASTTYNTASSVKSAFVTAINSGAVLAQYEGHGANQLWGKAIFKNSDISSLTNGSKLPFVLALTCLDGYFHWPALPSLEESLVLAQGKGAIAAFAATGQGLATGHDYLARGIFNAFFVRRTAALGAATFAGKLELYTSTTSYRDLISTYGLLGDPSMNLALPSLGIFLPVVTKQLAGGW